MASSITGDKVTYVCLAVLDGLYLVMLVIFGMGPSNNSA